MSWLEHHTRSEQYAIQAEMSSKSHDDILAIEYYVLAAKAELKALDCLDIRKTRTVGITVVSTASLYYKAKDFLQAKKVAKYWLAKFLLPPFAVEELQYLLQDIDKKELESGLAFDNTSPENSYLQIRKQQQIVLDSFMHMSNQEIQLSPLLVDNEDLSIIADFIFKQDLQPENLSIYPLTLQAQICLKIGVASRQKEYWFKGLYWLKACWNIHQKIDDLYGLAEVSYELAVSHEIAKNPRYARAYYRDAQRIFKHLSTPIKVAFCHHSLGRLLLQLGEIDLAINEFDLALAIYQTIPDIPQVKSQIGNIHYYQKVISKRQDPTLTHQVR